MCRSPPLFPDENGSDWDEEGDYNRNSGCLPCCRRITGTFLMTCSYSMELVALWHMKAKIQMDLKGVVQVHREFDCHWLLTIFKSTSNPHAAESWGRCITEGIAVGCSAFIHFPLRFLLLAIVR